VASLDQTFDDLVSARRGHFVLESGLHAGQWLDLDGLFADPTRLAPLVEALAARIQTHNPGWVCGPMTGGALLSLSLAERLKANCAYTLRTTDDPTALFAVRYRLPDALRARISGATVVLVDDVMSAGSSLRASHAAVIAAGAQPVAVAALRVLGDVGARYFAALGLPVLTLSHAPFQVWPPETCPLCASGQPLTRLPI
jgi:orotate phosphoribosyltransferase